MKILFVCSSNVCRSPYCEFVFSKIINSSKILTQNIEWVRSAAVFNKSKKLHSKAVVALLAEGFNEAQIASYRPMYKRKDINLFEEADIIIGMTRFHKFLTPTKYKSKFTTLSQVALKKYIPIPDPFLASNQKSYDQIMFQIKDYLKKYATCLLESFTDQEKQN